ncbi:MAG TPA: class IV adenylate cyclase [Terriglobales bacterium]|nr:class IV adenylate cyclase [Terriglobales bacterium]
MSSQKEIEIKFRVDDLGALGRQLRRLGFRRVTKPTREMNTLYDLEGTPLRRRGELLRLRQYGTAWLLTHKAKGEAGRHKTRVESETEVCDGRSMAVILRALHFKPTFQYEKLRAEWNDGNGAVVVDETPIGNFSEIEGSPRFIERTARRLGVQPADYITATYAELFARWKQQTKSPASVMTFAAIGKAGTRK